MPKYCEPLQQCRRAAEVGAKAVNLGYMARRRIPVPAGVALTNKAFELFCRENSLSEKIAPLLERIDYSRPDSIYRTAGEIAGLIQSCRIPAEVWRQITASAADLGCPQIIVRSSAIGEDSAEASFAGQLDSITASNTALDLKKALLRCWTSYWSARSLFYQHRTGVGLRGMGVVFQQWVNARISGVAFSSFSDATLNEIIGEENPLLVEYVYGPGEALVSGQLNPGRIVVSRNGRGWKQVADPETPAPNGTDFAWISLLKRHALDLEKALGRCQDLEWAVDEHNTLFLLQCRPITAGRSKAAPISEKVLWSNVNVNENYPDPVSPLLYSVALKSYECYFRNLGRAFGVSEKRLKKIQPELAAIIGSHGARIYYNLSNIYRVICVLPFGRRVAGFFDAFVGVNDPLDPEFKDGAHGLSGRSLKEAAELIRMLLTTIWTFALLPWRIRSLEQIVDRHLENVGPMPCAETKPPTVQTLLGQFRKFLHIRFSEWRKAALADAAAMFGYGLLKAMLEHAVGNRKTDSLHNTLLKGIPNIVSSQPPQKIWELAEFIRRHAELKTLFETSDSRRILNMLSLETPLFREFNHRMHDFLHHWGFRCSGELMLTVPNFREQPQALFDILKSYVNTKMPSPKQIIEKQEKDRNQVLQTLRHRMRWDHWYLFKLLLQVSYKAIAYRERVRMKQAALYAGFRQTLLAMGRHLSAASQIEAAEDIFFMKYPEIEAWFAGTEVPAADLCDLIQSRKTTFEQASGLHPPDYLLLDPRESYDGSQKPYRTNRSSKPRTFHMSNVFAGIGACGGKIEAKARVLESVLEAQRLQPGEILVARQTDPGWGPLFPLIKGLVMERGGMLSHGAIIAREFGIPAVVGIADITRKVTSGQRILVDGDEGYVRL